MIFAFFTLAIIYGFSIFLVSHISHLLGSPERVFFVISMMFLGFFAFLAILALGVLEDIKKQGKERGR